MDWEDDDNDSGVELTQGDKMICAGLAGAITTFVMNPLEVMKTHMQLNLITDHRSNVFGIKRAKHKIIYPFRLAKAIYQRLGLKTLWSGAVLAILSALPNQVLYYSNLDKFRESLQDSIFDTKTQFFAYSLSGAFSRGIAVSICTPIELVKVRQQTVMSRSIVDTIKSVKAEIDREGILFLYKGFGSTLFRDITFSSIYCYLYSRFRTFYSVAFDKSRDNSYCILLGGFSGASIASIVTAPIDIIKTSVQLSSQKKSGFEILDHIKKKHGIWALFRGCILRGLQLGIMMTTYEMWKKYYKKKKEIKYKGKKFVKKTKKDMMISDDEFSQCLDS